jgi:hypothetical protein
MRGAKKGRIPRSGKDNEKEGREARARPKGKPAPQPQGAAPGQHLSLEPTWGQTKGKDAEMEQLAPPAETKELPVRWVNGDVEVGVPQVY